MRYLLPCLILIALAACSQPQAADIEIQNAHIVDPVGTRGVALGGLDITAKGEAIRLLSVSTPAAERIEIHATTQDDTGRMQMRRLDDVAIAPGTTAELGSGKMHFMVFGFDEALNPGDTVELTLRYEQGEVADKTITVTALIMEIGEMPSHGS